VVSPDKTKYMKFPASLYRRSMKGATINGVTYGKVTEFIYLGTLISNDNSVQKETQRRNLAGNRTYFAAISLLRNRLLSRATKIRVMSYIYMERLFLMFLDHTQRRSTAGRTPLDE